jgi:hypothetical protein
VPTTHVATANGVQVFGSAESVPDIELDGRSITGLCRDRDDVWAIADGRAIWRRTSGAWSEVAALDGLTATCLAAIAGELYVGTSEAHLFRLEGDGLGRLEAFDRVEGRDGWFTPWGGPPDTRSIANWDDDVFVNVHVGGIPRTDDRGGSWRPTIEIEADVHHVTTADDGLVLAACARGLAASADHGATWTLRTDGLEATYCRAVAVVGDEVVVSSSSGPRGGRAAVYRAPLRSGPFERVTASLGWFDGNVDTYCLDADPERSTVAFGTADGRLFVSTDAGSTWDERAAGLPQIRRILVMP